MFQDQEILLDHYEPPKIDLWKSRDDGPGAVRFSDIVTLYNLREDLPPQREVSPIVLIGFCCDEGVRRNHGRAGAAEGPNHFRKCFSSLAVHHYERWNLFDAGNIYCKSGDLEGAQRALTSAINHLHEQGVLPIVIGGGHEVSWGHYRGILNLESAKKCKIINFDAHFDLRPLIDGVATSGTPFHQIALGCEQNGLPFQYSCFGIQKSGNTRALFEVAKKLEVQTVLAEEINVKGSENLLKTLKKTVGKSEHVYLSLDMDVFSASAAPGVSAPQPLGLSPWDVIPAIQYLASSGKVIGFDVAELSPRYDQDNITSKLAASIVAQFLEHYTPRH